MARMRIFTPAEHMAFETPPVFTPSERQQFLPSRRVSKDS